MAVVGQCWLWFGILSILWALPGTLICCYIDLLPQYRLQAIICLFIAGNLALISACGAFGFAFDHGNDDWICSENLEVGISLILAFASGSLMLLWTFLLFLSTTASSTMILIIASIVLGSRNFTPSTALSSERLVIDEVVNVDLVQFDEKLKVEE